MARDERIERVIYLGGLGDRPHSEHLRSRHETALLLRRHGPALTYFRAGMVVGPQSESYRTLRYLVQRLPAMIAPAFDDWSPGMPDVDLFQRALGLAEPWQVVDVKFDAAQRRLDLRIDFPKGSKFACPECGREGCPVHDTESHTWRHVNFEMEPDEQRRLPERRA